MRVYVGGGRDYNNVDRVEAVLRDLGITELATGACKWGGADLWAEQWARRHEINYRGYPAKWRTYGNAAGPIRNREGIELFTPELIVAFPGGRGTADMLQAARERGYTDDQLLVVTDAD